MTTDSPLDPLLSSWERQQEGYVAHREQRFEVVLTCLAYTGPPRLVLDLGAGTGAFTRRILDRFPAVRAVAVDYDPALLALARHQLAPYGDRISIVEADLADPEWADRLPEVPDAAVSSTALHWLTPGQLLALYTRLGQLLPAGATIFNADHLRRPREDSFLHRISAADDAHQQDEAFRGDGIPDWNAWWRQLGALPGFAELVAERERRFGGDDAVRDDLPPAFHLEALRAAGFVEAGTIWQHFDDYVIYGVR
ncbi:class I SAM-dependent methyltransferase [Microbacterium sp.]|uniref:class I SAM-dependent methyltransferase n=1 Tax=Microbacterium sp. TaxID=51671 RepID=UPI003C791FF5